MLRVSVQQGKLFIGAGADQLRQGAVVTPEIGSGPMVHGADFLERLNATVFLIVQSAINRLIEAACCEIGWKTGIHELRVRPGNVLLSHTLARAVPL
jgi:hypothetical protein